MFDYRKPVAHHGVDENIDTPDTNTLREVFWLTVDQTKTLKSQLKKGDFGDCKLAKENINDFNSYADKEVVVMFANCVRFFLEDDMNILVIEDDYMVTKKKSKNFQQPIHSDVSLILSI